MYRYLFSSQLKLDFGVSILENPIKHNNPTLLHDHDYYETFIVIKGEFFHYLKGKETLLSEGMMVFIHPQDKHYFRKNPKIEETNWINISFDVNRFDQVFAKAKTSFKDLTLDNIENYIQLTPIQYNYFLSKIDFFKDITYHDNQIKNITFNNLLEEIFIIFYTSNFQNLYTDIPSWLKKLIKQINNDDNYILGLPKLIEISGKSQEHLTRCMKKYLDISPTNYINLLRLNKAANILVSTTLPILDISLECGFDSISYFNRLFKEKYKLSPSEYRKVTQSGV